MITVGMDVHKNTISLCAVQPVYYGQAEDQILFEKTIPTKAGALAETVEEIRKILGENTLLKFAYEAGCLGLVPYYWLKNIGEDCLIMAPTTMETSKVRKVKTDRRDAYHIAHLLAHGGFHAIHIPDETDRQVRDFIRMRDQARDSLKRHKQNILAFCLKLDISSTHSKWSQPFLKDLQRVSLPEIDRETLDEYLVEYDHLSQRLERLDRRIEELAGLERYKQKVGELRCLAGIETYTAMTVISEIGDFSRFKNPEQLFSYVGLVPGEESSGEKTRRKSITKSGNSHVRKTLTEASQGICRGKVGFKSRALKKRQEGQRVEVIEYADRGSRYLRKKYYSLIGKGKGRNVAVTAIARSLLGFIWGIMTGNLSLNHSAA